MKIKNHNKNRSGADGQSWGVKFMKFTDDSIFVIALLDLSDPGTKPKPLNTGKIRIVSGQSVSIQGLDNLAAHYYANGQFTLDDKFKPANPNNPPPGYDESDPHPVDPNGWKPLWRQNKNMFNFTLTKRHYAKSRSRRASINGDELYLEIRSCPQLQTMSKPTSDGVLFISIPVAN